MTNLTTERAVKKAYFTDLAGGHIVEFQFAPHDLDFTESGHYIDRVMTGNYFTDLVWISGKPTKFSIQLFIDRTQESYTVENYNKDPFDTFRRFPNRNPQFGDLDIANLINGIRNSNTSSGFATSFRSDNGSKASNEVKPSSYSASPQYAQSSFDENVGVIKDLEALMYYVRPKGLKLEEITIQSGSSKNSDGGSSNSLNVNVRDFKPTRFTPPPMVRFYYGAFWREGYITEVKYTVSVMNKLLVPRRLDATIEMACVSWGYLNEITQTGMGSNSTDSDGDSARDNSPSSVRGDSARDR